MDPATIAKEQCLPLSIKPDPLATLVLELKELNCQFVQQQEFIVRKFSKQLHVSQQTFGTEAGAKTDSTAAEVGPRFYESDSEEAPEMSAKWSRRKGIAQHNPMSVQQRISDEGLSEDGMEGLYHRCPRLLEPVIRLYRWWSSLEEPERDGPIVKCMERFKFEIVTVVMIGLNGALVIYQTNVASIAAREGLAPDIADSLTWEFYVECFFVVFFLLELILRLVVHQSYFFCNKDVGWNIFDLLTIAASVISVGVAAAGAAGAGLNMGFLRVLRIFRMTRSLRILRALHFIRSLRQLVDCILTSFSGLFWCMVLLLFLTGIFAVFLVQCATSYWQEGVLVPDPPNPAGVNLVDSFGTVRHAMLSLLKATSGGTDWGSYFAILSVTGMLGPSIFVVYILFFLIAAWNIVTSLFVEKALAIAQPDLETRIMQKQKQDLADVKDILHHLELLKGPSSGTASLSDFLLWMANPGFKRFLETKDIHIKDPEFTFTMFQEAVDMEEVSLTMIVDGLMRLRGAATNMDIQALNFAINSFSSTFDRSLKGMFRDVRHLGLEMQALKQRCESPKRSQRPPPTLMSWVSGMAAPPEPLPDTGDPSPDSRGPSCPPSRGPSCPPSRGPSCSPIEGDNVAKEAKARELPSKRARTELLSPRCGRS